MKKFLLILAVVMMIVTTASVFYTVNADENEDPAVSAEVQVSQPEETEKEDVSAPVQSAPKPAEPEMAEEEIDLEDEEDEIDESEMDDIDIPSEDDDDPEEDADDPEEEPEEDENDDDALSEESEETPDPEEGPEETPEAADGAEDAEPTDEPAEDLEPTEEPDKPAEAEKTEETPEEPEDEVIHDAVTVVICGIQETYEYDGKDHEVNGYTIEDITHSMYSEGDFTFTGASIAKRVGSGVTYMGLAADQFRNTNPKFDNVKFVVTDGFVQIDPTNAAVTIKGEQLAVPYDGEPHMATGFSIVSINTPLYNASDFSFLGDAFAERSEVGISEMGLSADLFENNNRNFADVDFIITDGYVEIKEAVLVPEEDLTEEEPEETDDEAGDITEEPLTEEPEVTEPVETESTDETGITEGEEIPAEGTEETGEGEEVPAEGSEETDEGEEVPAEGTDETGEDEEVPAEGTDETDEDEEVPAEGTDETDEDEEVPVDEDAEVPAEEGTEEITSEEGADEGEETAAEDTAAAVKVAAGTNVFAAADLESEVIFTVETDSEFPVLGTDGEWVNVQVNEETAGYISLADVASEEIPEAAVDEIGTDLIVIAAGTDIRAAADGMSEIIYTVEEDTDAEMLGTEGAWVKVMLPDGTVGFVFGPDLGIEAEQEDAAAGKKVMIFTSRKARMEVGEEIILTSVLEGFENCTSILYQWECDKGSGFEPVEGGDGDSFSYEASAESFGWGWRLIVKYAE